MTRRAIIPQGEPQGFNRTLQTASDADRVANLLAKVADANGAPFPHESRQLHALAERYRDYAAALRETAAEAPEAPAEDQGVLL